MTISTLSLFLALATASDASAKPPARGAKPRDCIAVVGTNDLHGALAPHVMTVGEAKLRYGGLIAVGAYVDVMRSVFGQKMVLVDAGDLYQGTLASNVSEGEAVIRAYNMIGYDATAIGNHDFDFGAGKAGGKDLLGVIKARIAQAKFPFLTANIWQRNPRKRVDWPNTAPSVLVDAGGTKVGIIGVSTVETARVTKPVNVATLEFPDPKPYIVEEAKRLRSSGAKLIVLTAHIGGKCRKTDNPEDTSSCIADSELFTLIKALPQGTVNVALGGHHHAFIAHWLGDTAVIEAGARGRQLAWVDACLTKDGKFDRRRSRIHRPLDLCLDEWEPGGCRKRAPRPIRQADFMGHKVTPPKKLVAMLEPYLEAVQSLKNEPMGIHLDEPLTREAGLGTMVCRSMQRVTDAQIAIQNRGGIRADIDAGPVTFGDLYDVLPFGNQIARVRLTGAQLRAFVDLLRGRRQGRMPYVTGLKLERGNLITDDGVALRNDAMYWVATSDFMAMGGEGLDAVFGDLGANRRVITSVTLRDGLVRELKRSFGNGRSAKDRDGAKK